MVQNELFVYRFAQDVIKEAKEKGYRTGQLLFSKFPAGAMNVISGTIWDPYYNDLTLVDIVDWINNHIVFDTDGTVIGVFANNTLMWEREYENG